MPASLVSPNVRLPVSGIRGIRLRHWVSRALERLTGPSKRVSVLRYRPGQGCISGPGRHTGHSGHGRIVVLWHGMDTLPRYRGSLNYKVSVCLGPRASGTATSSLRCGRRERTATSSLRCGRRERTATSSLRCGRRERTATSSLSVGTYGYLVASVRQEGTYGLPLPTTGRCPQCPVRELCPTWGRRDR
jgi:hypothetical protein